MLKWCKKCKEKLEKEKALFPSPKVIVDGVIHTRKKVGNPSVTSCGIKIEWVKGKVWKRVGIKRYFCPRCHHYHNVNSKIGKKHLEKYRGIATVKR